MGAVKINGTTSGSVSLEAPATGSDVTLTLPGTTMNLGTELASKLPIAGGKILQIVRDTDTTSRTTTSTSFVDVTGMSVTITPQKSDSTILLIAACRWRAFNGSNNRGKIRITDSSNNAVSGAQSVELGSDGSGVTYDYVTVIGWATPATTSAVTYKVQFLSELNTVTIAIDNDAASGQLFAIEVSA